MTFTISRKPLLDELALLLTVAEKKGTMPTLSNVMMDVADGKLTLYATNIDSSIVSTIGVEGEPWTGCLPMVELGKFVRLAESDELKFEVKESRMQIKAGKAKCLLPIVSREHFPVLPVAIEGEGLTLPGETLRTMLTRVLPCVATTESRYTMRGVKFETKNGMLKMIATNEHRLGVVTLPITGEINTLVPADGLSPLLKTTAETVTMRASDNQASFHCDHQLITMRLTDGQFPAWKKIWPEEMPHHCEVSTEAITAALKRVEITRNVVRDSAIRLTFEKESISIDSGETDRGQCDELLSVTGNLNGESVLLGVNPDYLNDFFRYAGEQVKCEFRDNSSVLKLSDGSAFEYIVMPMRI